MLALSSNSPIAYNNPLSQDFTLPSIQQNLDNLDYQLQEASVFANTNPPHPTKIQQQAFSIKNILKSIFKVIEKSTGCKKIKKVLNAFEAFEEAYQSKNRWVKAIKGLEGLKTSIEIFDQFIPPRGLVIIKASVDLLIFAVKLAEQNKDKIQPVIDKNLKKFKAKLNRLNTNVTSRYKYTHRKFNNSSDKLTQFLQQDVLKFSKLKCAI